MCSNSIFLVHLVSLKKILRHEGIPHKDKKACGLMVIVCCYSDLFHMRASNQHH